MTELTLLGLRISVYTRIARLALEEKKIDYRLEEVDIFADEGPPADYLELHPFGRIPCLRYGELTIYETGAICRYIDEAFVGPALQPRDPAARAAMNQVVSLLDSYAYRPMVWDVYVQRVVIPGSGGEADEALIESALPQIETVLAELESGLGMGDFLAGDALSLADLYAYPMLRYFVETREGAGMLRTWPRLTRWMQAMQLRPAARATGYHGDDDDTDGF
jgi:glutathione S-transferase